MTYAEERSELLEQYLEWQRSPITQGLLQGLDSAMIHYQQQATTQGSSGEQLLTANARYNQAKDDLGMHVQVYQALDKALELKQTEEILTENRKDVADGEGDTVEADQGAGNDFGGDDYPI